MFAGSDGDNACQKLATDVGGLWVKKSLESGDGKWLLLNQEIIAIVL